MIMKKIFNFLMGRPGENPEDKVINPELFVLSQCRVEKIDGEFFIVYPDGDKYMDRGYSRAQDAKGVLTRMRNDAVDADG